MLKLRRSILISALWLIFTTDSLHALPYAYITNSNSNTVTVIDTATNQVEGTPIPVGHGAAALGVSPDGSEVYVSNQDAGTVSVIDTASQSVIGDPISVGSWPCGIAFGYGGSRAYVANCGSGKVSVIDRATRTIIHTTELIGGDLIGAAANPAGTYVYVTDNIYGYISRLSTYTNNVTRSSSTFGSPSGLAVSPDGATLYVTNTQDNTLMFIRASNLTLIGSVATGASNPVWVALNPSGTRAYVSNFGNSSNGNTVAVIDTQTRTRLATITVGTAPEGVGVTPDGTKLYVVNKFSNNVMVVDTATNTVIGTPIAVGNMPIGYGIFIQPDLSATPTATPTSTPEVELSTPTPTATPEVEITTTMTPSPTPTATPVGVQIPSLPVSKTLKVRISANKIAGRAPLKVKFSATVSSRGKIDYYWDLNNDGKIESTAKKPVFTYTVPGKYKAGLTISSKGKLSKKATLSIKVTAPKRIRYGFRP